MTPIASPTSLAAPGPVRTLRVTALSPEDRARWEAAYQVGGVQFESVFMELWEAQEAASRTEP